MDQQTESIAALLRQTAEAHHQAFLAEDGADAEWPLWYADFLVERLPALLGRPLTRSELVYALVHLDRKLAAEGSTAPWPEYYAAFLVESYAAP